jgi:hypothetical protein
LTKFFFLSLPYPSKPLKRALTIALFVAYINSYTEFHEVLRLPLLVEHYYEHKQLVQDLSFWEFLVMHYKTNVPHDNQDNQLPFKDHAHSFTAQALTLPVQKIALREIAPSKEIQHSSRYHEIFIASHLSVIFQPPKNS